MSNTPTVTPGNITMSKLLDNNIKQVWQAFAQKEQIAQWYGPQEFTCTIAKMEFKKGGDWELTLHGPDGKDYLNTNRFIDVVEQETIIYDHQCEPFFTATIKLEPRGNKTMVHWTMQFHEIQVFEKLDPLGKSGEGLKQNLDKLEVHLMNIEEE